jgi:hypothetical protein
VWCQRKKGSDYEDDIGPMTEEADTAGCNYLIVIAVTVYRCDRRLRAVDPVMTYGNHYQTLVPWNGSYRMITVEYHESIFT